MRHLPFVVLIGCVTNAGGIERPACAEASSVVVSAADTELGYSAEDLVATQGGPLSEALVWRYEEGHTTMTVEIVGDLGEVRFVDRDVGGGGEESSGCPDSLEVDATVEVSTADGAFAESWAVTLLSYAPGEASFVQDLDAVTLVGTFDKWDYADPTVDYENLGADLHVSMVTGTGRGDLILDGAGWADSGCREAGCTEWDSHERVGTWGDGL